MNCWNSLSCLERWELYVRWGSSGLAACAILAGLVASYYVTKQITFLKAPRSLTADQIATITSGLNDKSKAIFQVTALSTSDEPGHFGGQLEKILKTVGWESKGMTLYYMDGGDSPPIGVNVMVDGHDPQAIKNAEGLSEVFKTAGIQEVQFSSIRQQTMPSPWVLIQIGRKPNF